MMNKATFARSVCTQSLSRNLCCSKSSSSGVKSYVRNAQAAEVFRSSFFKTSNRDSMIPTEDLDQLVVREHVRPSLLLAALEVTGMGLGLVARFAPKVVATNISSAVDDAAVQQFNDSIRNMQLESVDNVDVKETLKYHRELRGEESEEAAEGQVGQNTDPINAKTALSSAVYHMLKLSGKY